jgi:hypothetical protein
MRRDRIEPPDSKVVVDLKALETKVVAGAVFRDDTQSQKSATETVAAVEAAFHAARHTPRHFALPRTRHHPPPQLFVSSADDGAGRQLMTALVINR